MISFFIHFRSLSAKLLIVITAIVAGVGFTIGAAVIVQDWFRFRTVLEEKALILARNIAISAPDAILQNDSWSLFKNLRKMAARTPGGMRDTRILSSMVIDPSGIVLAHLNPIDFPVGLAISPKTPIDERLLGASLQAITATVKHAGGLFDDPFVEGIVPVYSDQKKIAIVRLRLSTTELNTQAWRGAYTVFGITFVLVVIGSLFGMLISRRLIRPLTALADGMKLVGCGDFSNHPHIVATKNRDEIGRLAGAFNHMANELEKKIELEKEMAANDKMVALGRISAGVAHEVNNPLAGILNCLDTLKKHPDDMKLVDRYLPIIEKGLNRIRLIVAGLLAELRMEDAHELAGPTCLDDMKELALIEIGDKPICLNWDNRLSIEVELNRQRIQQVVLNLLKNAFQALIEKEESKGGTVNFRALQDGNCLVFEVEDDGPGIDEENLGRLFDPFFTTRPDGTGLGLWITYRLVRSMNGTIDVSSECEEGTKIQVFLPAHSCCGTDCKTCKTSKEDWII